MLLLFLGEYFDLYVPGLSGPMGLLLSKPSYSLEFRLNKMMSVESLTQKLPFNIIFGEENLFISGIFALLYFILFFFFLERSDQVICLFECIYRHVLLKWLFPSSFWKNDWDYGNYFEMSLLVWKWRKHKSYLVRVNSRQNQKDNIPRKQTAIVSEIAVVSLPTSPEPKLWDVKLSNTAVSKRRVGSY